MNNPDTGHDIGTLRDYTNDRYRVYFEVGEHEEFARDVIASFLKSRSPDFAASLPRRHGEGYEIDIPIQLIPEIVRELAAHNVAVYQVIRGGRCPSHDT